MRGKLFEFSARELSSLVSFFTIGKPWQAGYIMQHKWFLLLSRLELLAYVA